MLGRVSRASGPCVAIDRADPIDEHLPNARMGDVRKVRGAGVTSMLVVDQRREGIIAKRRRVDRGRTHLRIAVVEEGKRHVRRPHEEVLDGDDCPVAHRRRCIRGKPLEAASKAKIGKVATRTLPGSPPGSSSTAPLAPCSDSASASRCFFAIASVAFDASGPVAKRPVEDERAPRCARLGASGNHPDCHAFHVSFAAGRRRVLASRDAVRDPGPCPRGRLHVRRRAGRRRDGSTRRRLRCRRRARCDLRPGGTRLLGRSARDGGPPSRTSSSNAAWSRAQGSGT